VNDNAGPATGLTGDSGGVLTAVCVQASTKIEHAIEQVAAIRIVDSGTEITVKVDESCSGAFAS
jgi:hypothetical protein